METKHIIKKKIKKPIFRSIVSLIIIGLYIWFLITVEPDFNHKILVNLILGLAFPLLITGLIYNIWSDYKIKYKNIIVHKIVNDKK